MSGCSGTGTPWAAMTSAPRKSQDTLAGKPLLEERSLAGTAGNTLDRF
ncbi:MAG: hypothetical protein M0R02_11660 [Bacteroidales bacterium]|nr:hypothetical protein [Bacteroidales bacterium]